MKVVKQLKSELSQFSKLKIQDQHNQIERLVEIARKVKEAIHKLPRKKELEELGLEVGETIYGYEMLLANILRIESYNEVPKERLELDNIALELARYALPKDDPRLERYIYSAAYFEKDPQKKKELEDERERLRAIRLSQSKQKSSEKR